MPLLRTLTGLCDDAAIFPPGLKPLAQAVPDHLGHVMGPHADLVGPFILSAAALQDVGPLVEGREAGSIRLAVTVPDQDAVAPALTTLDALPAFRLVGLEVPLSADAEPRAAVATIRAAVADRDLDVFVEIPRDGRRSDTLDAVQEAGLLAKFRTGGIRAELYPDVDELADAIVSTVSRGLPFKATAGLHHAVRNTDPETGFDQHGFLNLLAAVDAALSGADRAAVAEVLADRDGPRVAGRIREMDDQRAAAARDLFRSFGTCSISEPAEELTALGLIDNNGKA
jgi:hypothetical protein